MEAKKQVLSFVEFIHENYSYIVEQKLNTEDLVIKWWEKNKEKKSSAKKSLDYWIGATDEIKSRPSARQDNVLANLKQIVNSPSPNGAKGTTDADVLNKIITSLESLSKNGVYLQDFSGSFLNNIVRTSEDNYGLKVWKNPSLEKEKKQLISDVDKVISSFQSDKTRKAAYTPLTDEVKKELISKIEERAQKRVKALTNQGKKNYTLEKAIDEAISIWIAPDKEAGSIEKIEGEAKGEGNQVTWNLSYPNKENPLDTKMLNFFGDNEYLVSAEDRQQFETLIKENIESITSAGGKIIAIAYSAGASTSKVRTSYQGKGKTGGPFDTKNNEILVKDRLEEINRVLRELLDPYATKAGIELTKQKDESAANRGPGWGEYSTENGKFEYGPLYEEARKKDSNLKPIAFYSPEKRKSDPAIKDEYEDVFGKFRGSYGEFSIVAEFKDKPDEPKTEDLIGIGSWKAKITWKVKPQDAPPPKRVDKGGGKSYVGVKLDKTSCFVN